MTEPSCGRESETLQAIADGSVSDELRAHAAGCLDCSESLLVASFLRRAAAEASSGLPVLPQPGYLWWRAHIERRAVASERATRAITLVQRAALVSAALLTAPLLRWGWPHVKSWLAAINPAPLASALPGDAARPGLVVVISLVVVAALALLDLYGNWVEQ